MIEKTSTLDQRRYVPWRSEFLIGDGYDVLSDNSMVSAIDGRDLTSITGGTPTTVISYIKNQADFDKEIEVSVSGSATVEGVKVKASADLLSNVRYSTTSMSLVISWCSDQEGFERLAKPALTSAAATLASDANAFRMKYGDYYVSGGLRRGEFHAVYVLSAASLDSLTKFEAAVAADVPNLFSAAGSTKFSESATNTNVSISVYIYHTPSEATSPSLDKQTPDNNADDFNFTPATVADQFKWFTSHRKDDWAIAELTHYSALDDKLSRVVQVPPTFFGDLASMDATLKQADTLLAHLPASYQNTYGKSLRSLEATWQAERSTLWSTPDELTESLASTQAIVADMQPIETFFQHLAALSLPDGGYSRVIGRGGGAAGIGMNGDTTPTPAGVVIQSDSFSVQGDWVSGHLTLPHEWHHPGAKIVSFTVESGYDADTRGALTTFSGGLNSDTLNVGFEADFDRGLSWEVTLKYVECD